MTPPIDGRHAGFAHASPQAGRQLPGATFRGFAMAMPATIIIRRSSGGLRGVLSSSVESASRSRTALRTARRKRSVVQRAPSA